ncbi:Quaternary ammonium compoundresistance protein SugE CDS [Bradyrhizobium sp.]|nr:Quaternary ammonium compoundresistance protein SugE CDS [Bradyrhizobium sp.]
MEGRHGLEHPVRRRSSRDYLGILLGLALKSLPVGTAYAVWTGIGAVGTATLGIILFGEPATAFRLASIGLIVAGIAGLKFVT